MKSVWKKSTVLSFLAVSIFSLYVYGGTTSQFFDKSKDGGKKQTVTTATQKEIERPPIDVKQPDRIERATFALG